MDHATLANLNLQFLNDLSHAEYFHECDEPHRLFGALRLTATVLHRLRDWAHKPPSFYYAVTQEEIQPTLDGKPVGPPITRLRVNT